MSENEGVKERERDRNVRGRKEKGGERNVEEGKGRNERGEGDNP